MNNLIKKGLAFISAMAICATTSVSAFADNAVANADGFELQEDEQILSYAVEQGVEVALIGVEDTQNVSVSVVSVEDTVVIDDSLSRNDLTLLSLDEAPIMHSVNAVVALSNGDDVSVDSSAGSRSKVYAYMTLEYVENDTNILGVKKTVTSFSGGWNPSASYNLSDRKADWYFETKSKQIVKINDKNNTFSNSGNAAGFRFTIHASSSVKVTYGSNLPYTLECKITV